MVFQHMVGVVAVVGQYGGPSSRKFVMWVQVPNELFLSLPSPSLLMNETPTRGSIIGRHFCVCLSCCYKHKTPINQVHTGKKKEV